MAEIAKRTLGRTGAKITSLGYGSMELRGAGRSGTLTDDEAGKVLNAVLDSGIDLIDTSIDYGMAEERIGKYISNRRNEYFLASKCGCLAEGQPVPEVSGGGRSIHVFTQENVIAGVEQSLRRLQTDHLDLVQVHASPSKQVLEDNGIIEAMQDLQTQGKVRFLGMSGTIPNLVEHIAMGVFDVFQIPYSCIERDHENLIAAAHEAGAGVFVRGGAAKGGPSGEHQENDRAKEALNAWGKAGMDDLLNGDTPMEFVLRFTSTHPGMSTNIVGTSNADHLKANVAAVVKGPLPGDVYDEAKRRLGAAGSVPKP
jgi:aryl-alcohol dehydrogenase-like predicted oxidoreductase